MASRARIWLAFCMAGVSCASGAVMQFSAPVCGQPISGTAVLSVSGVDAATNRVEFAMGSHRIGTAAAPGFAIPWNSAEAMDGVSAIQATARDIFGKSLGEAECLIAVSNRGASLTLQAPDVSEALSGVVTVTVTGADTLAFPAVWTLNIDGEQEGIVWTDNDWQTPLTVSFTLDTTQFANGAHELHISMNSRTGPSQPQWVNWRGMVNRVIRIDNGAAWQRSAPVWRSLSLQPGQSAALGCVRWNADGTSAACSGASFASSDTTVATVDASGTVTAVGAGLAQITLTDGPQTATAEVWVASDARVPHFTGAGAMRTGYAAGESLFVIAPFFLDPDAIGQNTGLGEETTRAGVNALGFGVYSNPRDTTASFASWRESYDQTVGVQMRWARDNGFHLLLTGDDIFRQIGSDAWFTLNWPLGMQAVQYAVASMAATGVGIGIEAIDEASSIWGPRPVPEGRVGQASYLFTGIDCSAGFCTVTWPSNPVPNGWEFALAGSPGQLNTPEGSLFMAQQSSPAGFQFQTPGAVTGSFDAANDGSLEYLWFAGPYCDGTACDPPVPNAALGTMRGWMTAVPNRAMMAFPPLAVDTPEVHGAWMGPGGVSDYASNYFSSLKTRTTYPWTEGIQEIASSMETLFFERQPYLMLNRPQLMEVSLAGASYTKGGTGSAVYQPGVDALDEPGVSPEHVSMALMEAAALGGAGVRLYFFEPASDAAQRATDPIGAYEQTGANPSNLQSESWRAMGYASRLLTQALTPYLFGAALSAPDLGPNIRTAVRRGGDGDLLLIVNGNDWPRQIGVSFDGRPHSFGTARYRIGASGIETCLLAEGTAGEKLRLGAGESAAYFFPASAAAMPLSSSRLSPPAGMDSPEGVQYSYIYAQDLDRRPVMPCGTGCDVAFDPRLGPIYYRFVTGQPAAFSPVMQLNGAGNAVVNPTLVNPAKPREIR